MGTARNSRGVMSKPHEMIVTVMNHGWRVDRLYDDGMAFMTFCHTFDGVLDLISRWPAKIFYVAKENA